MKVKYIGETSPFELTNGKVYDVLDIEEDEFYRIVDDTGEDYLYFIEDFEIVEVQF